MENPAQKGVVLVVDDDPGITAMWRRILRDSGIELHTLNDPLAVAAVLDAHPVDVAVFDIQMPGKSGLELLAEAKAAHPALEVIVQTGYGTVQTAVEAMKAGAYDFLTKPFEDLDQVPRVIMRALDRKQLADRNRQLKAQVESRAEYEGMVGNGAAMKAVFETVETVAFSQSSVLVTGESGTGKELVARALHYRSPRKDGPFVPVNCAAITETLLESELFGHVKGSFTGAAGNRRGLFEAADHGTIFLDEVGEIPQSVQVKLLRVLQEGELRPVGSSAAVQVDVRVVAATNRDLAAAIAAGTFRDDLYYRLNVITIALPALRDRRDDIPVLAHHFLRRYAEKMKKDVRAIEDGALAALAAYRWPGNIRELENAMERAVVLCKGDTVAAAELSPQISGAGGRTRGGAFSGASSGTYKDEKAAAVDRFERAYFTALLEQTGGRIAEAARLAGLDRSNFRKLLDRHPAVREKAGKKADEEES